MLNESGFTVSCPHYCTQSFLLVLKRFRSFLFISCSARWFSMSTPFIHFIHLVCCTGVLCAEQ
jgi:hypothetical protein